MRTTRNDNPTAMRVTRHVRVSGLKLVLITTLLVLTMLAAFKVKANVGETVDEEQWKFKVYLDDTEIGYHHFSLSAGDDATEITSEARFEVKFLFFTAYSYEHENTEIWNDGCLARIDAFTNDNGTEYRVEGLSDEGNFVVNDASFSDRNCMMTFAYWDPSFLKADALLNSQTGEVVEVESEFIGEEAISIGDRKVDARRYRLKGDSIQIDLWYSADDRWLGLESLTEGGRTIRYSIQQQASSS